MGKKEREGKIIFKSSKKLNKFHSEKKIGEREKGKNLLPSPFPELKERN